MFRNGTEHSVEVLEGIEGVYRYLGSIPPNERFSVSSVKKYCNYLVVGERSCGIGWKMVPASRLLSSTTTEMIVTVNDRDNVDVQEAVMPPEPEFLGGSGGRAPGFYSKLIEFRDRFKSRTLPVKSSRTVYSRMVSDAVPVDAVLAEKLQLFEIGCVRWVRALGGPIFMGQVGSEICAESSTAQAALELWESKEKVFKLQIDSWEAELKDCNNQIFQWVIGFYAVVHGVLLTVVSQPDTPFTCSKIYVSYVLSAMVSFFTIAGVVHKLKPTEYLNEIIYEHKARLLAVCSWQSELKSWGMWFDYGTAVLNYKPRPKRSWWLPKCLLPPEAANYVFVILMCSAALCYIMHLLKCN